MPKVNLEILRTMEITREERIEVEVDVPDRVLGDPVELHEWVEEQLDKVDSDLTQACVGNWEVADETENPSIDQVINLDDDN